MLHDPSSTDVAARKEQISEHWDSIAEKWDAWGPVVERWFAPATSALLERLELKPGDRVLELAAGSGGFTLRLARAVGPDGRVIATDIGPNMVKLAARNARSAGLSNVVARVMDGENPDVTWASMDAVACRQGFMFFADPATALARLYKVLRPGGHIGLTVFSTPDRNSFIATPIKILSHWVNPEGDAGVREDGPGPFRLSAPGLLESMLTGAGFVDLRSQRVSAPMQIPTVDEYIRFDREILGDPLADRPVEVQRAAWKEIARASTSFTGPASNGAQSELLVVAARRPLRTEQTA
jgi:ubiquinone/menaquinone biosynthesis C-methylase UbiE